MQMMQTGTREYLGKNKFWTPSNIAITQSIVDNSIANINLTDSNSSELFTTNDDKTAIQTKDGIPLEASQFRITSTNAEIGKNNSNAVNKSYCDSNYIKNSATELTLNNLIIKSPAYDNKYIFEIIKHTGQDVTSLRIRDTSGQAAILNSNHLYANGFSLLGTKFINFNTNYLMNQQKTEYPQGKLTNIVPSDITTDQMTNLTNDNLLDNVCPTYKYCENTYAKKADSGSSAQYTRYYQNSTDNKNFYIRNITSQSKGSHFEIPLPSRITANVILISVKFSIRCYHYYKYLPNLYCSLNTRQGKNTADDPTTGILYSNSYWDGQVSTGTVCDNGNSKLFSFNEILTDLGTGNRSVYLHFFFDKPSVIWDEVKASDGNDGLTQLNTESFMIPYEKNSNNVQITVVGLN